MINFKYLSIVLFLILLISCKEPQARRPISHSSGTFLKESVERNKKIVKGEEGQIDSIIKSNPNVKYIASNKGYWYRYIVQNNQDTLTPKKGDIAFFDYEIKDLKGNIIYTKQEIGPQTYYVDKQNIMMGLRDGIKIMHKKEKINFLFTSQMGYGYHGDDKKIGTNMPLLCIVTLRDFMSEANYKKELELKTEITSQIKSQDTITQ